ncbi:hypothetical protein M514_23997 [Trichuris suis]|uniref:DDE-1 domain-containing protein n=1 Tax=Trichuris suis TaxID=68888 RepID=A0A085N303_9BILA|nr:hypothetical protein M514_23997 [Trichuris suis]
MKKKQSILLTVDNCPGHPQLNRLTNVTLKFVPPNGTSKIQPVDQGIIKTFKMHYRAQLPQWIITKTQTCGPHVEATSSAASDNPGPMAEFEGVDLEGFVAVDDEVATCSEPDPEAVFQAILTEVRDSVKVREAADEPEEASEDDTEMAETLKEEDVRHLIMQLKSFAAKNAQIC